MKETTEKWLSVLLAQIRPWPGAYLGNLNVRSLELYINAYSHARADLGLPRFSERDAHGLLEAFTGSLKKRLANTSNVGWADLIERLDPSDRNVLTFFREFDVFLADTGPDGPGSHGRPEPDPTDVGAKP